MKVEIITFYTSLGVEISPELYSRPRTYGFYIY